MHDIFCVGLGTKEYDDGTCQTGFFEKGKFVGAVSLEPVIFQADIEEDLIEGRPDIGAIQAVAVGTGEHQQSQPAEE